MKKLTYIFVSAMFINVACSFNANALWFVRDHGRMINEIWIMQGIDKVKDQLENNVGQSILILKAIGEFGDHGQIEMFEKQSEKIIENLETVKYVEWALEGEAPVGLLEGVLDAFPSEEEILASLSGADRRVTLQLNKQARDRFVDKLLKEVFITEEEYTKEDYDDVRRLRQEKGRNAAAVSLAVSTLLQGRIIDRAVEVSEQEERVDLFYNLRERVIRGAELETEGSLNAIDAFILASLSYSISIYKELQLYPVVYIEE